MTPLPAVDRRQLLKTIGAATAPAATLDEEEGQLFEIIAKEQGDLYYWFTVEGEVEKAHVSDKVEADDNDCIIISNNESTRTVRGFTGNPGYGDAYRIKGEITSFKVVKSNIDFYLRLDGHQISADQFPRPSFKDHHNKDHEQKPDQDCDEYQKKPAGPHIKSIHTGTHHCSKCSEFQQKNQFSSYDSIVLVVIANNVAHQRTVRFTLNIQIFTTDSYSGQSGLSYQHCKMVSQKASSRTSIEISHGPIPASQLPSGEHQVICTVTDLLSSQSVTSSTTIQVS